MYKLPSIDTKYNHDLFLKEYNCNLNAIERILNSQKKGWGTHVKTQINNLDFSVSEIKIILISFIPTERIDKSCLKSLLVDVLVDSKKAFNISVVKN
jgi:hypothetical protein